MLVVVAAIFAAGFGAVYALSERLLRRQHEAPLTSLHATGAPDVVEGERMARIVGCWNGCHGRVGEGGHAEIAGLFRNVAPTLSQVLPLYNDQELARLIRYGVKRDGRSAVGMASFTLWALGDQDLSNLIAHLRRQPTLPTLDRELQLTWKGRLGLLAGTWKVSAEQVDRSRPRWGDLPQSTPLERGRYLANVTCTECHGLDFRGTVLEQAPSLAVVGAYSREQFLHLIRTAQPVGGRQLREAMTWVVDAPFTDAEVMGIYEFLREYHGFKR